MILTLLPFQQWLIIVLLFVVGFILLSKRKGQKGHAKYPPGPRSLPIVGNMHQLAAAKSNPYLLLSQWAQEFGSLYTLNLGPKKALVVNSPKLMKEIFSQFASTGKFKTDTFLIPTRGERGIISTSGKAWQEQRQFAVRSMRTFGFGKGSFEQTILNEAIDICELLKIKGGEGVQMGHIFQLATINTLWSIVAGERFDLDNVEVAVLLENVIKGGLNTVKTGLMFFPWLKHVAPDLSGFNAYVKDSDKLHDFIESRFVSHEGHEGDPRDLIDCYVQKLEASKNDVNSNFGGREGRENCLGSVLELFIAGGETTSNSLTCMVLYLCQHPEVQRKLHQEIVDVIGSSREPSLDDRKSIPFMEAVILETLRLNSFAPIGLIHELIEDMQYEEYHFPKGMLLIPNLYHAHHSEDIWGDPGNFRPERFIKNKDESEKLKENVVAFQPGKRSCLGEGLAKDIMFLFGVKLVQTFQILPAPGVSREDYMEPEMGYILLAKPVKVIMKPRC